MNTLMSKPSIKLLDEKNPTVTVRLNIEERKRYNELMRKAKAKYKFINKSDINRELFGLAKLIALSEADIHYFRTGEKG